jgi:hypothetical protein
MDSKKRAKVIHWIIISGVFIGLLAFFCVAHPLILADTDDWYNSSHWRRPLPVWGEFGGIKVLPETLLPFCSLVAANLVMPFRHDYLMSLALVYGVVAALFITVYTALASRLIKALTQDSGIVSDLMAVCFLLFHFLMYKNEFTGNVHLLWAHDVTCLFHYTFSSLMSACLVMFFLRKEIVEGEDVSAKIWSGEYGYLQSGVVLLLVYLAIFSNMFNNIVLAAFAGIHALIAFIVGFDKGTAFGERVKLLLQRKWLFVATVVMWVVADMFQTQDPRNDIARSQGATSSFSGAIKAYVNSFTSVNKMAALIMVIMFAAFLVVWFGGKADKKVKAPVSALLVEIILSFVISSVYLLILCGVASPEYLARNDVKVGLFFFIVLAIVMMFGWSIANSKGGRLQLALPILLFILAAQSLNYCKPFKDYNMNGFSYEEELRVATDLMEQYKAADEQMLDEFELHVLYNEKAGDNWPYPSYAADLIGDALFRHGVISRPIKATTVFDPEKNEELLIRF